jgi:hypothetical protein
LYVEEDRMDQTRLERMLSASMELHELLEHLLLSDLIELKRRDSSLDIDFFNDLLGYLKVLKVPLAEMLPPPGKEK